MNYKRAFLYSFFIWLIPFLLSFFFFSKEGVLLVDRTFFNVIMTLSLVGVFSFFLYLYIKKCHKRNYTVHFGVLAFFVSTFLDLIVLVGFFSQTFREFFQWTLPSYFNIIIISFSVQKILILKNKSVS